MELGSSFLFLQEQIKDIIIIIASRRQGGWSFINKSTSLEGFLVTFGRLSPLDCTLTPLLDG